MKNTILIIVALFVINTASSQQTVSLTFQAYDWGWLIGKNTHSITTDSASNAAFRNIRSQIIAINPTSRTQSVTVNNIPAWVGVAFYKTIVSYAGEVVSRYTPITNELKSKPALSASISAYDAAIAADAERTFISGKNIIMDN